MDIPNDPLYPFGYGLSYTSFEYSNLVLDKTKFKTNETIKIKMKITNTGKRDGEEIVQLYLRDLAASISRPVKELKGYKKVMVPAGQSTEITFDITSQDLAFWNKDLIFTTEPGEFDVMIGASSADIRLKATIELVN